MDLGFSSTRFTWSRGSVNSYFKGTRFDRALCNMEWGMRFQSSSVEHLVMTYSDHSPILVKTEAAHTSKRKDSFKFQATWLTNKTIFEVVENNLNKGGEFTENIQRISQVLTSWNREVFENIGKKKR